MEKKKYVPTRYNFIIDENYERVPNSNKFKCIFVAKGCEKIFTSRLRMEAHVNNACRYSTYFQTANKLQGFEENINAADKFVRFSCEFCESDFATKFKCIDHLRKSHWSDVTHRNHHPTEFTDLVIKENVKQTNTSTQRKRKKTSTTPKQKVAAKATATLSDDGIPSTLTSSTVISVPLPPNEALTIVPSSTITTGSVGLMQPIPAPLPDFPVSLRNVRSIIVPDTNVFLKHYDLVIDISTRKQTKLIIVDFMYTIIYLSS